MVTSRVASLLQNRLHNLLSLDMQDIERRQLKCAQNCTRNPCIFQLRLSLRVIASEILCLGLTESTRLGLILQS